MLIEHKMGRDPALWVYLQRKFGNSKAKELQVAVDDKQKQPQQPATPDVKPDAPAIDYKPFCAAFTTKFAKVLSGFAGGMTEVLAPQYFTAAQIADLNTFMSTNAVPPNLFHQAGGPALTAQHKILLAGEILVEGTLPAEMQSAHNTANATDKTGKKHTEDHLHADNCGHWASQVYLYAGVNQNIKSNVANENTDIGGTLHLSNGTTDTSPFALTGQKSDKPLEGKQADAQQKATDDGKSTTYFRRPEMGEAVFDQLKAGDWIYIYNANSDITGEHSEVFIGWADNGVQKSEKTGNPYRTANVMSQMNPTDGGRMHTQKIGTDWEPGISPVTSIQRVTENSGELVDINSLIAGDADTKNDKALSDGKLDPGQVHDFLLSKSATELAALKNLDVKQQQMFQHAIDGAKSDSTTHGISLLVACVQKLDLSNHRANGVLDSALLKQMAKLKAAH